LHYLHQDKNKIASLFVPALNATTFCLTARVSTGVENPGKSLNWKKKFQDWKVLENQ
jgi:hypothetical protein